MTRTTAISCVSFRCPAASSGLEWTGPAPVAVRAQVLHPLHVVVELVRGRPGESGRVVGELTRRDDITHAVQEPVGRHAVTLDLGSAPLSQRLSDGAALRQIPSAKRRRSAYEPLNKSWSPGSTPLSLYCQIV